MKVLLLIVVLFVASINLMSQETFSVWSGEIPGSKVNDSYVEESFYLSGNRYRIKQVTDPTYTIYYPKDGKPKHKAILVCPGGGYSRLAYDTEGVEIANRLTDCGFVAVVLKYRLPEKSIMEKKYLGPLQDVQKTIRTIRAKADELGVYNDSIGVMGFSAGGHLASSALTLYDYPAYDVKGDATSARPDFGILVYPVISMSKVYTHMGSRVALIGDEDNIDELEELFSTDKQVKDNMPPVLLFHAANDNGVTYKNSLLFVEAMIQHKNRVEYHIFPDGGHGFGLAKGKHNGDWFKIMEKWILDGM